ncbi:MAG: glucose-1-phosphate adenylyltransferase subunit GlgD [Lawsonibacter sp.]|nr:glucose-1-phosphate adenylyltransferase subunit GlgD [Lawsonibacter sp.]
MNDLHGILFAYRSDANLGELTRPRNTCSLPFGGRYRLIDFMLSNYVNAGINDVGLVVHQSYQSLLDHVGSGKDWELSRKHGGLRILPPFSFAELGHGEYRGTMDALAGVTDYLENIRQDYVIMAWGDVALNLPVSDVFAQHLASGADITVVCTPILHGAPQYSEYVEVSADGRITDLSIHPTAADKALESLEIYILSKRLLMDMTDYCAAHDIANFSRGVLQPRLKSLKMVPYVHKGYVARFQSVSDYYQRSMDLLDASIRADLFNPMHPIRTKDQSNPSTYYGPSAVSRCSLVADGCYIEGEVENSILSRGVIVEKGAKVVNSVLMQGTVVKAGASLSYVIADKNVQINEDRMLMGHQTYPLAIAKESVV